MHRLILACVLLLTATGITAAEVSPRTWTYQYVFATSTEAAQFDPLVRHIRDHEELQKRELIDYVAEALVSPTNKLRKEAVIVLLEGLEEFGSPRYRDVVAKVESGARAAEVKALAGKLAKKYRKVEEAQYVPGSIDFARLRAEFTRTALATVPDDAQASRLASVPLESSIEKLFTIAGPPQSVLSAQTLVTDAVLVHVRVQRLWFYYRGVGRALFQYVTGKGWQLREVLLEPEAFEAYMPYRTPALMPGVISDQALAFTQLLSNRPISMKVAASASWRGAKPEPAFLDAVAEVLLKNHRTAEDWESVDAYAWMCRLLATYGGPRYANVLKRVKSYARSGKLRKYADLKIEKVNAENTAPYVAGSVSLDALRAQYPPLYPQRTAATKLP